MRAKSVVLGLVTLATALPALADEYPMMAYVQADGAYVRSGPGRDYYPTDKLQKGAEVEIYRRDPGGWLAIRPPEGSYCWVSSRYLTEPVDGLSEVTKDQTVARVGSRFSAVRDVIQVRLDRGELVEVLESHNGGGQTWYKIAPPSGEFRWISAKFLHSDPPNDGISRPRHGGYDQRPESAQNQGQYELDQPQRQYPARDEYADHGDEDFDWNELEEETAELDGPTRPSWTGIRRASYEERQQLGKGSQQDGSTRTDDGRSRTRGFTPRRESSPREPAPIERVARAERAPVEPLRRSPRPTRRPDPRDTNFFADELADIEWELSVLVSEEPTVWQFDELEERALALVDEAATAVERGKARRVLRKIDEFNDIRARYEEIGDVMAATDRGANRLDRTQSDRREDAPRTREAQIAPSDDFDGEGILRPVVSRRMDAPKYALVDANGDVKAFITPTLGLNLHSYLGQRVGLTGTRGYMPELKRPHITASRITPLDKMLR